MPKILITGASGFVGSWLVKEALGRGWDTFAGIRSTSSKDLLDDPRINFSVLDFKDPKMLSELLAHHQFDIIVHNAGVTRAPKDSIYYEVNSEYSATFAKLSLDVLGSQLKKFVYMSSIEAFGSADLTPDGVVDNSISPSPRTTYGKSKLRAEKLLNSIQGLPLLVLRPTAVFGPAERDIFAVWKTIKQYRFAPVLGDKNIQYSFVYVKDLARVVIDASSSEIIGKSYFVSDGRIHKIADFTGHVANSLGLRTFGLTIPYGVLDGMVMLTKFMDRITGRKSLLNDEQLAKMKARSWDCDISELVKDFDYQARYSLEEAIKETTQWYRDNQWI